MADNNKETPAAIVAAQDALRILHAEDPARAAAVQKTLAGYAMRIAKTGAQVTTESLLEAARKGPEALKQKPVKNKPVKPDFFEQYSQIKHNLWLKRRDAEDNTREESSRVKRENAIAALNAHFGHTGDQISPAQQLADAAQYGDTAILRSLLSPPNVFRKEYIHEALEQAAAHGHIESLSLLVEHTGPEDRKEALHRTIYHAARNNQPAALAFALEYDPEASAQYIGLDTAVIHAAQYNNTQVLDVLLKHGADPHNTAAMRAAIVDGNVESVDMLHKAGASLTIDSKRSTIDLATQWCRKALIEYLLDHGESAPTVSEKSFMHIIADARMPDIVDILLKSGATLPKNPMRFAVLSGKTSMVRTFLKHNVTLEEEIDADEKPAMSMALFLKKYDIVSLLLDHGATDHVTDPRFLKSALDYEAPQDLVVKMALNGGNRDALSTTQKNTLDSMILSSENWRKIARRPPPEGLRLRDPAVFKPLVFDAVREALQSEGYDRHVLNRYAYNTMLLFQTEERVLEYMERWATSESQPLHDIIHMIDPPKITADAANLKDWGDAVLKHGPKMARLFAFCDKIPSPEKSDDGKVWSYSKTYDKAANFAYQRAGDNPELAKLCFSKLLPEHIFDSALNITQKTPPPKNIPDIKISGDKFDMPGATFYKLDDTDVRGLFLGQLTNCCQSLGSAGEQCAYHGYTSPHSGFYVIEDANNNVIGQTWAWRGTKGELTLDSLETLGARVSDEQWKDVLNAVAKELNDDKKHRRITALHVGTGGGTPRMLQNHFQKVSARPLQYKGYRDSEQQLQVWANKKTTTLDKALIRFGIKL